MVQTSKKRCISPIAQPPCNNNHLLSVLKSVSNHNNNDGSSTSTLPQCYVNNHVPITFNDIYDLQHNITPINLHDYINTITPDTQYNLLQPLLHTIIDQMSNELLYKLCYRATELYKWQDLQSDLLSCIFSYLDVDETIIIRSVCKSYLYATNNTSAWLNKPVRIYKPCDAVDCIPDFCSYVTDLSVFTLCDRAVPWLSICQSLVRLECEIDSSTAFKLLCESDACHALQSLTITTDLDRVHNPDVDLIDSSLVHLTHLKQLTYLSLLDTDQLTCNAPNIIGTALPQLQKLLLRTVSTHKNKFPSFNYFTRLHELHYRSDQLDLYSLCHNLSMVHTLQSLTLETDDVNYIETSTLNDSSALNELVSLPYLSSLTIDCYINNNEFMSLVSLKKLKSLSLVCCVSNTNSEYIANSLREMTQLTYLKIVDAVDYFTKLFIDSITDQHQFIELSYQSTLGVEFTYRLISKLHRCKHLQVLQLQHCSIECIDELIKLTQISTLRTIHIHLFELNMMCDAHTYNKPTNTCAPDKLITDCTAYHCSCTQCRSRVVVNTQWLIKLFQQYNIKLIINQYHCSDTPHHTVQDEFEEEDDVDDDGVYLADDYDNESDMGIDSEMLEDMFGAGVNAGNRD